MSVSSAVSGAILTSPLSRARRTAESIAEIAGIVPRNCTGLIDIDCGDWQGLTPEEARARWPREIKASYEDPERVRIPGGETPVEAQDRARVAVREACERRPGIFPDTIAMVSHTVVIRLILLGAREAPLSTKT
jgi:probable phosphoglycerate mutase